MNTLIHLIALALVFWFSWWLLDQGKTVPGIAALGVAMVFVAWTIQAAIEDIGDMRSGRRRGRR